MGLTVAGSRRVVLCLRVIDLPNTQLFLANGAALLLLETEWHLKFILERGALRQGFLVPETRLGRDGLVQLVLGVAPRALGGKLLLRLDLEIHVHTPIDVCDLLRPYLLRIKEVLVSVFQPKLFPSHDYILLRDFHI